MSTRCTVHFKGVWYEGDGEDTEATIEDFAIIYRHQDGYPECAGVDLHKFIDECGKMHDSRWDDPNYLAAKYVVWLANQFNVDYDFSGKEVKTVKKENPLDFLSVGIVKEDPSDIQFRYEVLCVAGGLRPMIRCYDYYKKCFVHTKTGKVWEEA